LFMHSPRSGLGELGDGPGFTGLVSANGPGVREQPTPKPRGHRRAKQADVNGFFTFKA